MVQGRRDYYPGVFGLTAGGSQDPIRKSTSDGVHSRNLHQQLNDGVMRRMDGTLWTLGAAATLRESAVELGEDLPVGMGGSKDTDRDKSELTFTGLDCLTLLIFR